MGNNSNKKRNNSGNFETCRKRPARAFLREILLSCLSSLPHPSDADAVTTITLGVCLAYSLMHSQNA